MNKNPFFDFLSKKMWNITAPFVGVFLFVFILANPLFAKELIETQAQESIAETESVAIEEPISPEEEIIQSEIILGEEQISRLEDLKGMLDKGEITQEEYEKAKEETINEVKNNKVQYGPNINSTDPKYQTLGRFIDPTVSPLDGSLNYQYQITVPSGRNGLSPDIKLAYNSNNDSENSILGTGWSFNIPYIQRMNKGGSDKIYTEDNFFSSLDGELVLQGDNMYIPKVENGSFLKYKYQNDSWIVYDKKGTEYNFGKTQNGRQDDPNDNDRIFSFLLEEVKDSNGNTISYSYFKDQGQIYPDTISYNQNGFFSVKFYRTSRERSMTSYTPGFRTVTKYRISNIQSLVDGTLVAKYLISSSDNLITNITLSGYKGDQSFVLPPTKFKYQKDDGESRWNQVSSFNLPTDQYGKVLTLDYTSANSYGNKFIDLNGDGLEDILRWKSGYQNGYASSDLTSGNQVFLNTGSGFSLAPNFLLPTTSTGQVVVLDYNDPNGTYGNSIFDINNDGLPDVVRWAKGYSNGLNGLLAGNQVFLNTGTRFSLAPNFLLPTDTYGKVPTLDYNKTQFYGNSFKDVNGDGRPDIVRWFSGETNGYAKTDLTSGNQIFINQKDDTGFLLDPTFLLPTNTSGRVLTLEYNEATGVYGNKFIDINGDGLLDILRWRSGKLNGYTSNPLNTDGNQVFLNTGSGFLLDSDFLLPTDNNKYVVVLDFKKGSVWADENYKNSFFDINGDKLIDVVRWRAGESNGYNTIPCGNQVFLNNGRGFEITSDFLFPTDTNGKVLTLEYTYSNLPNGSSIYGNQFIDINGDGLPDILRWAKGYVNGYTNSNRSSGNQIFLNTGKGFELKSNFLLPTDNSGLVLNIGVNNGSSAGNSIRDIDGDKIPDVVRWRAGQSNTYYSLNDGNQILSNMIGRQEIKEITNSKGGKNSFTFIRVRGFKENNVGINASLPENYESFVVLSHSTNDSYGNIGTTSYEYRNVGYYYAAPFERKFTGFNETIQTNPDGGTIKTKYHQNNGNTLNETDDSYAKIGKLYEKTIEDEDGNLYSRIHIKYEENYLGNNSTSVLPKVELTQDYDGNSNHTDRAMEYEYDEYGNVTKSIDYGKVNGNNNGTFSDIESDKRTVEYIYDYNLSKYIVSDPKKETLKDYSENKQAETNFTYDSNGNLLMKTSLISNASYAIETFSYNDLGMLLTSTNPLQKTTTYIYDTENLYPIKIINALGHTEEYTYDYAFGKVKQVKDSNGFIYEYIYDGLGRLLKENVPDFAPPYFLVTKNEYIYTDTISDTNVKILNYLDGNNSIETYQYFDGFGRLIQERKEAEIPNNFNVKDIVYNNMGLLEKESLKYTSVGSIKTDKTTLNTLYTNYTYDTLGRVKNITNSIGTTSTTYNNLKTTTIDANGKTKKYYKDIFGNLVKVEEINGTDVYTTNYEWNILGKLTKITDALLNIRNFTYDNLGRRLTAEDLHRPIDTTFGIYTYIYDNAGNIIRSISPDGKVVTYTYDALSRKTVEDYLGTTGEEVSYLYDCLGNIGRLCSTFTDTATNTHYTYNSNNKIASEKKIIDGVSYVNTYTYDIGGNVTNIIYPDGGEVKYTYNTIGLPEKIERKESGGTFTNVISSIDYSPMDQITTITYPNMITTTNIYDAEKGYRLTRKLTQNNGLSKTQDLNYSYDSVGNIIKIIDASNTNTSKITNYTYDDLYRLLSSTVTNTSNNQNYTETFSYNAIGNILTKNGNEVYTYNDTAGGEYANPHAVTKITAPTYSFSFSYDKNGNLTRKTNKASTVLSGSVNGNGYTTYAWYESTATGSQKLAYGALPLLPYILTDLDPDTIYQFRVVAQNEKGTTYGDWISVKTGGDIKPVIFSSVATPSTVAIKLKGSVSASGESTYAWYESSKTGSQKLQYTYIDNCTTETTLPTYTLSGLTKDTNYRFRVVAQNKYGTTYGDWINTRTTGALYPTKTPIINSSISKPNTPLTIFNNVKYNFNYKNELKGISGLSIVNTYTYDASSNRVKATAGGVSMYYPSKLYSRESSTNKTKYIYLPSTGSGQVGNTLVSTIRTQNGTISPYYIHTDHLGSISEVSNDLGTISQTDDYYSYGSLRLSKGSCDIKRKYIGEFCDNDTTLAYLNARYYDGTRGQFISQDPVFWSFDQDKDIYQNFLMDPQGQNSYSYARNNPINQSDPTGKWWKEWISGKQSTNDFKVEVGQASQYMYDNNQAWKISMDHPYAAGAVIGVGGGAVAFGTAAGATILSVEYLGGAGTACLYFCNQNGQKLVEQGISNLQQLPRVIEATKKMVERGPNKGIVGINNFLQQAQKGTAYLDNKTGNINIFSKIEDTAKYTRVTLNPEATRIISAGLNSAKNVINGINNGRFIELIKSE